MRHLIFFPLLLLVACSPSNTAWLKAGFGNEAAKPTVEQPITAINSGVIQTQTLAPIGQTVQPPIAQPPVAQPPAAQPNVAQPTVLPNTAAQSVASTPPNASQVPASAEELACRAKGGQWGKAGKLAAMTCYIPSKDAGKSCSKQSDCSSQCLARSRTCAPIWPIFGCSEVLQNDGSLVKLCID